MIVLSAAMRVFLFLGLFRRFSALRTTPSAVVVAAFQQQQQQQQQDLYRMRMMSSPAFITSQQRSALDRPRGEQHALYAAAASSSSSSTSTRATTATASMMMTMQQEARRKVLLSRTGPHLKVDRMRGTIEFGATANLVTQLQPPPPPPSTITTTTTSTTESTQTMIDAWLRDENRGLAMSIWDPQLMTYLGNDVYRLQIMTLQFVTITLAPWVDVQMRTTVQQVVRKNQNDNHDDNTDDNDHPAPPEFIVQSIGFEPNIQILPGMRVDAQSLGIVIEVAGELRPGSDGTSVTGGIAFQTSGILPPPMRFIPDPILKAASDTINQTIVNFVLQNFRTGAQKNFQEFVVQQRRRRRLRQEQQQQQKKEEQ
jgi:hypothetical protein